MIKWAIGSLAAYNALPAAVQAEYAARYDEPGAAWTALQAIDPLGDDYTWELISDVTLNWPGGSVDFNARNFVMTSRVDVNGNPNFGYKITINAGTGIDLQRSNGNTDVGINKVNNIVFVKNVSGSFCLQFSVASSSTPHTGRGNVYIVHDCLFKGSGAADTGYGLSVNDQFIWSENRVYNCKFWDTRRGYSNGDTGFRDVPTYDVIEGCTFYNHNFAAIFYEGAASGWDLSYQYLTIRNCHLGVSNILNAWSFNVDNGGPFYYDVYAPKVTVQNCSENMPSGDGKSIANPIMDGGLGLVYFSESDVLSGLVQADEFISLDDTNKNFLSLSDMGTVGFGFAADPRSGIKPLPVDFAPITEIQYYDNSILSRAGAKPSYALNDITGYERGQYGDVYSIGCHEAKWVERFESQKINEDSVVLG